jgi:NDP-sugar pyrophosphorylase family protein
MTHEVLSLQSHLVERAKRSGRNEQMRAVVLAGGRGTRLAPFTSVLPKPLMPIHNRAILEVVIEQLRRHDIVDITLCVGHLSHLIQAVLSDGSTRGVTIRYVHEEEALGTAAPLRHVEGLDSTFLVMNGDILTALDFQDLISHHHERGNLLTIATRQRQIKIDYGVLRLGSNSHRDRVRAYTEKPEMTSTVSMGIYVLEPEVLDFLPDEGPFDFPHLVQRLLRRRESVGAYQYDGMWFDIGRQDDYVQAVTAWTRENDDGVALDSHGIADSPSIARAKID